MSTESNSGMPSTTQPGAGQPATEEQVLRQRAVTRLKKQSDFRIHVLIYLMVNTFLVVIWAITSAGFFWPIFPIAGWGIGVVANAWDAYGRDVPTESQISREMERLRGMR